MRFHLRRAAVRSLSQHPFRIANTCIAARARVTRLTPLGKVSIRPFSYTAVWRADERDEIRSEETNALEEGSEIREQSIQDPTVTDAAAEEEPSRSRPSDSNEDALSGIGARQQTLPARQEKSKIVYIGNLFFEVTTAQVEAEFSHFGEIVNARVVTDPSGLSKGFAFVEYADQSAADQAIRKQANQNFHGRRMNVQYHILRQSQNFRKTSSAREMEPSKTLFIGNLSYQMSDRDLSDLFRPLKKVIDVRVAIDRRTGQPRGFAHADFTSIEAATEALKELSSKVIHGRPLRIGYSAPARLNPPSVQED